MNNVNNHTSITSKIEVKGNTCIDHEKMTRLHLTCAEYVMISYFITINSKYKEYSHEHCYSKTGLIFTVQDFIIENLQAKKHVDTEYKVNKNTSDVILGNDNKIESEFLKFWNVDIEVKGKVKSKVCWPGSRPDAYKKYQLACLKTSCDELLKARDDYFAYLDYITKKYIETEGKKGFMRSKMMASKFLLPANEHYKEDWRGYMIDEMKKYGDYKETKENEVLTKEEADNLFK